jgi:hypothetical protein
MLTIMHSHADDYMDGLNGPGNLPSVAVAGCSIQGNSIAPALNSTARPSLVSIRRMHLPLWRAAS